MRNLLNDSLVHGLEKLAALALVSWLACGAGTTLAAENEGKTEKAATPAVKKSAPEKPLGLSVDDEGWNLLFDGKTLKGWKETDFAGRGLVKVENGQITMEMGNDMSGVTWTNEVLRVNYELTLEAARLDGGDFFCGLTFPVMKDPCSLILGGWGGGVVGLSSIGGMDASSNETTTYMNFKEGRFYKVRLRVTEARIQAWLDEKSIVDITTEGRTFSIRLEVEESQPLGVATWRTKGALKNIKVRKLDPTEIKQSAPRKKNL